MAAVRGAGHRVPSSRSKVPSEGVGGAGSVLLLLRRLLLRLLVRFGLFGGALLRVGGGVS